MNLNISNLISEVNEARFLIYHESCECKCGLNGNVRNSKQQMNHDECRCDFKELDDWGSCQIILCGVLVRVRVIVNEIRHLKLMNT